MDRRQSVEQPKPVGKRSHLFPMDPKRENFSQQNSNMSGTRCVDMRRVSIALISYRILSNPNPLTVSFLRSILWLRRGKGQTLFRCRTAQRATNWQSQSPEVDALFRSLSQAACMKNLPLYILMPPCP